MDLSLLNPKKKANKGAPLHLRHPGTELPLYEYDENIADPVERESNKRPVTLYVLGVDSDLFSTNLHKKVNAMVMESKAKKARDQKTSEQQEAENIEQLADLVVGWENASYNGSNEFTREAVVGMLTDLKWIREQVNEFAANRANFI